MIFSEYFIVILIINIKITVELLDYKILIKSKVIKIIKLVIGFLKFINIIVRTIILTGNKLIKFNQYLI